MPEFFASDTSLLVGIFLLLLALCDYIFMRYFARSLSEKSPEMQAAIRRAIAIAPYWIAGCVVGGLYLVMGYMRSGAN